MKVKSPLLLLSFSFLLLQSLCAQNKERFVDALDVFDPNRIEDITYKLVLYNQNNDKLSDIAILDRSISKEKYNQTPSIRITEEYTNNKTHTKTLCFVESKTLLPLYLEVNTNDTLTKKYYFEKNKIHLTEIRNSEEIKKELDYQAGAFLSNSFSEILQSIDFSNYKKIQFSTFSPGKNPGIFNVEVIDEKKFKLPNKQFIDSWVVQFTIVRPNGETKSGGYRYIDKKSGKVLAFKTHINSDNYFTYQMNLLEHPINE